MVRFVSCATVAHGGLILLCDALCGCVWSSAIVHDATISGTTGAVDPNAQERALQTSILSAAQQKKVSRGQKPAWAYTAEAKVRVPPPPPPRYTVARRSRYGWLSVAFGLLLCARRRRRRKTKPMSCYGLPSPWISTSTWTIWRCDQLWSKPRHSWRRWRRSASQTSWRPRHKHELRLGQQHTPTASASYR